MNDKRVFLTRRRNDAAEAIWSSAGVAPWRRCVSMLFLAVILCAVVRAQTPYRVTIQPGVSVKMRDGVSLVADVYRPVSDEKFPVLLERTPYNRAGDVRTANELASHGYIVVIQDTRGRFASGGEFYPFRYESADGFDTVEWPQS